ncbi:ABC transporter substrate-binding protein [Stappia stellulata]|uniref:ABC transporter substrate-binding protein n=1 Tax=Stappia stellulata TaxID=71235 RepID=UPI000413629D|nr:ABC transporter substrate-binding protein [Stappia stellulata]
MTTQDRKTGPRRLLTGVAAAALSLVFVSAPASSETLRVVMQSGLRITDPIMTTAFITRDHGYMIYDTLLGVDSDFNIQPQMADWEVSDDDKTYTFTLRDDLKWHDGAAVTAEDAVASINRWAEIDSTAKPLMDMVDTIEIVDDKTFTVALKTPTTLLLAGLSKMSSRAPFIMPKRVAETPASQPIDEFTGSGPFVFVEDEFRPGVKVVYEKFEDYVPRDEPASWTAGGKDVKVDRVEWLTMPDQMTAVSALQSGEVDFIQQVPFDLLPLVENAPEITVDILDPLGAWTYFRMNWLHPPFDNKLVRQAAIAAVDQTAVMQALVGNPDYYQTCAAIMGCGNVNGDEYGRDWVVNAQLDKAKALLAEAGYDDTPVVIMAPTDLAMVVPQPIVIGDALRKAGFNVQMKMMDWQTLAAQQSNQDAPSQGGWNIFSTYSILATSGDPFGNTPLATDGRESWAGWPDVPEISALRIAYAKASSVDEQKQIAKKIQKIAVDEGVVGPLGQFRIPAAWNTQWSGFLESPITVFWNISKDG